MSTTTFPEMLPMEGWGRLVHLCCAHVFDAEGHIAYLCRPNLLTHCGNNGELRIVLDVVVICLFGYRNA